MVELGYGTWNPNYIFKTAAPTPVQGIGCNTGGKVHHFHREPIECLDDKTVNVEDLPLIDKCCRCGFEQEINTQPQKTQIVSKSHSDLCISCRKETVANKRKNPYCRSCLKAKQQDFKVENALAEQDMKGYREQKIRRIQKEALEFAKK